MVLNPVSNYSTIIILYIKNKLTYFGADPHVITNIHVFVVIWYVGGSKVQENIP